MGALAAGRWAPPIGATAPPSISADFGARQTYDYLHEPLLETNLTVISGIDDRTVALKVLDRW